MYETMTSIAAIACLLSFVMVWFSEKMRRETLRLCAELEADLNAEREYTYQLRRQLGLVE